MCCLTLRRQADDGVSGVLPTLHQPALLLAVLRVTVNARALGFIDHHVYCLHSGLMDRREEKMQHSMPS